MTDHPFPLPDFVDAYSIRFDANRPAPERFFCSIHRTDTESTTAGLGSTLTEAFTNALTPQAPVRANDLEIEI